MEAKLSQKVAERAKPGPKRYWLRDEKVKGLRLVVQPSGEKTWQVRYRVGRGETAPERTTNLARLNEMTHDDARTRAAEVVLAGRQGRDLMVEYSPVNEVTVAGLWEAYRAESWSHWSERTRKLYAGRWEGSRQISRGVADLFLEAFGGRPARTLARELVVKVHAKNAHRPAVANKALTLLGQVYAWARDTKRLPLDANPTVRIKPHEVTDSAGKLLSLEQLETVFAELAKGPLVLYRFFVLLALTGMRPGELRSLRVDQLDFTYRVIRLQKDAKSVRTKTRRARIVPMVDVSEQVLRDMLVEADPKVPWLFPGETPQGYMSDNTYLHAWRKAAAAVGLEARPYDLRHTFVTMGVEESMSAAQAIVGHKKLTTTQVYVHHPVEPLRRVSESVAARMPKLDIM